MNKDKRCIVTFYVIVLMGMIGILSWASVEYSRETSENKQYTNFNGNITSYNTTENLDGTFNGYIQMQVQGSKHCWVYIVSMTTLKKVNLYLELYYPLFSTTNAYSSIQDCCLSLPHDPSNFEGLIFSMVLLICLLAIILFNTIKD